MLLPSRMESAHITRAELLPCGRDEVEFWTRQILTFPDDFVTIELPERGEYVTYEVENGKVSTILVTSGWPQMAQ